MVVNRADVFDQANLILKMNALCFEDHVYVLQEEIKILATQVFVNPFKEVDEMLAKEREEMREKEAAEHAAAVEPPKPGNRKEEEAMEAARRAKKRANAGQSAFISL